MSIVFSKNKEKRARTTSNETNTSFVKNVTSRVSGLLPSTITKWFSSPSSSNANGSTVTADATDSSTEDEATESPVITQPPSKRMRFSASGKYNHFSPTDGNCSTSNIDITEIPVSPFSGSQFQTNRNSLTLTPLRSANEASVNDNLKDKNELEAQRYKLKHTLSGIGQSIAAKRKSIFDKSIDNAKASGSSTSTVEKKSSFKPSLFGSPFYPGQTMYGGAASSFINQPNIQQQAVALVHETKSDEDSVMSSSARRIMDLLEAYSSPLREASRIPNYPRPKRDSFNNSTERFTPYSNKNHSYKTQELHVPSIASILRLKQKSRLMDTTKTARQIIASHSSASSYPITSQPSATSTPVPTSQPSQPIETREEAQKDQNNKMTTKVKTRVTRTSRGIPDQLDIATPVKLPSATLQIDRDKLPTFSFDAPTVPNVSPKSNEIKKNSEVYTSKPETVTTSSDYKFSNPVRISCDTPDGDTTPPKFTFESPDRHIEQNLGSKSVVSSVIGDVKETNNSTTQPKGWQCPDCWVNNKADAPKCVCCGYKQPAKEAKCSVCKIADSLPQKDKCVLCEKMASPPTAKTVKPSKWKCESCWVMNEDSAGKCVCCGIKKPSEASKAVDAAKAAKKASFTKVRTPTCGGCFRLDQSKGPAEPIKPAEVPASTPTFFGNSGDSGFITLAKTQKSDKWECSSCLVRNESNKAICVCCGADREPKSKLPETKFNFGSNTNKTFKFGIDPKVQQSAITTPPEFSSTPEPKGKRTLEANNNVLAETPTYTFSLPTKKLEVKMNDVSDKPETNVQFSFGMPKDANANKFEGVKMRAEDNEKAQEVPEVNFSAPVQETAKPTGTLFSTSLTPSAEKPKPLITISSNLFARPTTETKNDNTSNVINLQPSVVPNVEKPQPHSSFTLGLKPASNLFAAPAPVSSSINPFTSPAQSITGTVSSPAVPIMMPAVQQTETSSNATSASATPMFSFGSNNANNSIQTATPTIGSAAIPADKANFQFTFGSNNSTKTEPAPIMLGSNPQLGFKSPFGSASDNIANNTNTFGLAPGSALGSNSALATTTNGISAANGLQGLSSSTLGGNTLSGNPLGGNTLTANSLSGNILGGNTMTGNTFGVNNLTGGNSISSSSTLGGANGLPGNAGGNGLQANNTSNALPTNPLTSGSTGIFGNPVQKENMWNTNSSAAPSTNPFVSNTSSNNLQKPAAFTFGTSTPFNATSPPPAFGNNAQPAQNIFGMANQNNNNQPSLFSNPVQNQTPTPLFGSPQPNNAAPQMGMFGTPNIGATPTFGAPNPTIPSFEAPSMPAPAPSFNFGAPSQPVVFGFGQQQPQQPTQQAGVYSFGGPPAGTPQVQFNMGTAPNPGGRRLRKAVRRTTPR